MIRSNHRSGVRPKRPNNFCYHCNQNFPSKDELKSHVQSISRRSNRTPDFSISSSGIGSSTSGSNGFVGGQAAETRLNISEHPTQFSREGGTGGTIARNGGVAKRRQSLKLVCDHCECIFPSMEALQLHTSSLMREKQKSERLAVSRGHGTDGIGHDERGEYGEGTARAGTGTLGTVKVECDFFELNDEEFDQIKNSAMPEFASFTLDGKECYHCGEEFSSTTAMHQHPSLCTRMKNATNLGKVMKVDGTLEEINGVKIHPVGKGNSRAHNAANFGKAGGSGGKKTVMLKRMEPIREKRPKGHIPVPLSEHTDAPSPDEPSDNLVIAGEEDEMEMGAHENGTEHSEEHPADANRENAQPIREEYSDGSIPRNGNHRGGNQHTYVAKMVRERPPAAHKNPSARSYHQLPVRRAGQSLSGNPSGVTPKGHCCYHCDRMFPSKDELRAHVAEISKMNLADY